MAKSLAIALSGNYVLLALDILTADGDPGGALCMQLLGLLGARHGSKKMIVDSTVHDARRLIPAYGTWKRKGQDTDERPHRQTTFVPGARKSKRLGLDEFKALIEAYSETLTDTERAKLTEAKVTTAAKANTARAAEGGSDLDLCSKVSISAVLTALGYDAETPECPKCGHETSKGGHFRQDHGRCRAEVPARHLRRVLCQWCRDLALKIAGVETLKGNKEAARQVVDSYREQHLVLLPERKNKGGRPARVYTDEELDRIGYSFDSESFGDEVVPEVDTAERRFNLTDAGNAERLVARHGKDIHYLAKWKKWLVWDGTRWVTDEQGTRMRTLALETTRAIYEEAKSLEGAPRRETVQWAQTTEGNARQNALNFVS